MEDKGKFVVLCIALAFLAFVGYSNFSIPRDKTSFNSTNLYRIKDESVEFNPRGYYNDLLGINYAENDSSCKTEVVINRSDLKLIGSTSNYLFVKHSGTITDFKTVIGVDGSDLFKDGVLIFNPISNMQGFHNSNKINSSFSASVSGVHDIEIIIDDRLLLVFSDVKTWWCHAHNPEQTSRHDKSVGNRRDSNIRSISSGATLGVSNATTKLCIYRLKQEYIDNGVVMSDVTDMSLLEKLNLGSFLVDGVEVLENN